MTDAKESNPQDKSAETAAATPVAALRAEPDNRPAQPIVIEQKGGGKGMAAAALVLSLIALGCGGFLFVQGQNALKTQELSVNNALDKAALGDSQNGVLLQNTLLKLEESDKQIALLTQAQADSAKRLESINAAYAELLKGRANWLVDEVEFTLNTASQQLLLSGNVPAAVAVLENIDQRLNRFEQPDLLPIKQAVSTDLAALKNRPYLNVSATSLRLDRLQTAVAGLPLLVDNTLQEGKTAAVPSQAAGFWERTWDNTVNLVKNMVELRKLESNDAMLIAPEQVYFVRENLHLRLMDARLALLQHNGEVFQNDLNAAEAAVRQYYDTNSPTVQAWLQELNELKGLEIRMVSDDVLKNSLAAVRNYQNSVRTATPIMLPETLIQTPPVTAVPPAASVPASAPPASAPAAAPEAKPETKSEAKQETKPEAKPVSKAEAKPEAKPEAKSASAAKPAPQAKPASAAKPAPASAPAKGN